MTCKEDEHEFALVFDNDKPMFECQNCEAIWSFRKIRHEPYYCSHCGKKLFKGWKEYFCSVECALLCTGSDESYYTWEVE